MNIISVHSKDELLTAVMLRQYFYGTTPLDILIWDSFDDAQEIYKRINNSNIFNRAFIVEPNAKEFPLPLQFKWYQEVIIGVSCVTKDMRFCGTLQHTNPYLNVAFYEDTPDIYTATHIDANKVFVFNPDKFKLPISKYAMPKVLTTNIISICNYLFGYTKYCTLGNYRNIIVTAPHPQLFAESKAVASLQSRTCAEHVIALEGMRMHPFSGEHINVLRNDYPLALLATNGSLENSTVFIYEPLAVSNLSLLCALGTHICIYLGVTNSDESLHYKSVKRIFSDCANVVFADTISEVVQYMEEL